MLGRLLPFALLLSSAAPAVAADTIIPLPLNPIVGADVRTCAQKLPSGVGYTVLKTSADPAAKKPAADDYVLVNYIGYLAASGQVFDQSMQAPFPVSGVVKGFGEGIMGMAVGAIHRICIPAALGYGAKQSGPIPPNSDLVFQVELIDRRSAAEVQAMQAQQATPAP